MRTVSCAYGIVRRIIRFSLLLAPLAGPPICAHAAVVQAASPVAMDPDASLRRRLEAAYANLHRALQTRDLDAVLRLRTSDVEFITPDGRRLGAEEMAAGSRNLLETMVELIEGSNELGAIERVGEEIRVEVRQHSIRRMRRDDTIRRIENWVTQRETWVETPEGLKLRRVDNIRDQRVLIDGRPRQ